MDSEDSESVHKGQPDSRNDGSIVASNPMVVANAETAKAQYNVEKDKEHSVEALRSPFDDQEQQSGVFDELQVAREALKRCCEDFSKEASGSKHSIFKSKGKSAKLIANEKMLEYADSDFDDVSALIYGLESEWKQKHSKAYHYLTKVCTTLNSHKEIFSILPNQSIYASVFCGTLSVLVQAAVNHSSIAETLSRSLADLSSAAALCAKLQHVIKTDSMKHRLADVYTKLFSFFRDTMSWYMKSRASRFFDSFNDNVNKKLEETAQAIQRSINGMYSEAAIGGLGMQRATLLGMSEMSQNHNRRLSNIEASLEEVKAQLAYQQSMMGFDFGPAMVQAFLSSFEQVSSLNFDVTCSFKHQEGHNIVPGPVEASTKVLLPAAIQDKTPSRGDPAGIQQLENHIVGSNGVKFVAQYKNVLVESNAKAKLEGWLSRDGRQQVLWMSSSFEPQHLSTARAAALAVVATSCSLDAPLISHFCEKPRGNLRTEAQELEKVGLIGLVYSLVIQLVNLGSETSSLTINDERLKKLDGTTESWPVSLSLLGDLLQTVNCLQYCVIHGLNDLESTTGCKWCVELLDILLKYQNAGYNILFTTSGQSRVLSKSIQFTDRFTLTKTKGEVEKRGKRLDQPTKTKRYRDT